MTNQPQTTKKHSNGFIWELTDALKMLHDVLLYIQTCEAGCCGSSPGCGVLTNALKWSFSGKNTLGEVKCSQIGAIKVGLGVLCLEKPRNTWTKTAFGSRDFKWAQAFRPHPFPLTSCLPWITVMHTHTHTQRE